VTGAERTDRERGLAERVAAVDHRRERSALQQLLEGAEVGLVDEREGGAEESAPLCVRKDLLRRY